ncbi:MAG: PSD1 domain-containing protein [Akkermansiaceae bacterium]|nr:PSD1 domain-containing protein [Akkermansiaceae bacterium]
MPIRSRFVKICALFGLLSTVVPTPFAAEGAPVSFTTEIRPLISEKCFTCHGPDRKKRKGDLRLDTRAGVEDSGIIVPRNPEESEFVKRLFTADPDEAMPPPDSNLVLSNSEKTLLRQWIAEGAEYEEHWAFTPLAKPPFPGGTEGRDRPENPIDRFVAARLRDEGLEFAPEADRPTLVRRVTLDLTGLPPAPEAVAKFVADPDPDAYEKLVDELLRSRHYGERMALPWLDAARYADSNGFQQDGDRHQYIWRDWVARAMNDNLPFDQFTVWQLAGDLLENPTEDQLIATGFNRNHMLNGEGGAIAEEQRNNYVFDRVDTTATVWLGLTLACAQCHDHKYDPLTTKDYYSFFAFFNNLPENGGVDKRMGRIQVAEPALSLASEAQTAREREIAKGIAALDKILKAAAAETDKAVPAWWAARPDPKKLPAKLRPVLDHPYEAVVPAEQRLIVSEYLKQAGPPELAKAQREKEALEAQRETLRREIPVVMVMREREGEPRETHILDRGDYLSPKEKVEPAVPEAFPPPPAGAPANRLGLARWLVSDANPLTARVTVNRQWQIFFGAGLVKTAEDFGLQGESPSHPDLLNWLAADFREFGWDVKRLHRLIVTSRTYRQNSAIGPAQWERDPENRLLARGARFRLPSMLLRDQALALGGLLVKTIGGPPVYPYQPPGLWEEFSYEKFGYTPDHGEKLYRRSLYVFWRRTLGPTTFFDTANRQTCSVKPLRTNTPLHALITLNDPAFVEAARVWAERIVREGGATPAERLGWALRAATARAPKPDELKILERARVKARDHFASFPAEAEALLGTGEWERDPSLDPVELASYAQVAQLILNLDEVLNRE